ncbi:hypothetical protein NliqN6_3389 [Naganishia liquefaciens]|uniref:Uncharacterized protein n=1 Tax=Naganishia liquefaciens TaxID=104408 RepID=A0A8H3TTP0_9TREE|nr:hypothetical protein NliqN6_3389 [Naganishia liquefaciens]
MGGPNLEILRFAMYLAVPTASILYFGDPEWYDRYVVPYGKKIWPDYETTHKPPHTQAGVKEQLEKYKAERLQRKMASGQVEGAGQVGMGDVSAGAAGETVGSRVPLGTFGGRSTESTTERLV